MNRSAVIEHLRTSFAGVYDERMVESHYRHYVEPEASAPLLDIVLAGGRPTRLLDAGCGYGAFVRICRRSGIPAIGIDIAPFETRYAAEALAQDGDDPHAIRLASITKAPFSDASFDVITMWNLLEHLPDPDLAIAEAARLLQPGGRLYLVCPNYAAFRHEAHYQLPWIPFFPKSLATTYLRWNGKNPAFLLASIHYTTVRQIHASLRRHGFEPRDFREPKLDHPEQAHMPTMRRLLSILSRSPFRSLVRKFLRLLLAWPCRHTIAVWSVKPT